MLKTYFLCVSIFITIYIFIFNILCFKGKCKWSYPTKLKIKLIYGSIWNCLFYIYAYILLNTPLLPYKYLLEHLILGGIFHVLAGIYVDRTTLI